MLKTANRFQHTATMNITTIAQTAAALKLTELVIRHAHTVQLARVQTADPQLQLPIEGAE